MNLVEYEEELGKQCVANSKIEAREEEYKYRLNNSINVWKKAYSFIDLQEWFKMAA